MPEGWTIVEDGAGVQGIADLPLPQLIEATNNVVATNLVTNIEQNAVNTSVEPTTLEDGTAVDLISVQVPRIISADAVVAREGGVSNLIQTAIAESGALITYTFALDEAGTLRGITYDYALEITDLDATGVVAGSFASEEGEESGTLGDANTISITEATNWSIAFSEIGGTFELAQRPEEFPAPVDPAAEAQSILEATTEPLPDTTQEEIDSLIEEAEQREQSGGDEDPAEEDAEGDGN